MDEYLKHREHNIIKMMVIYGNVSKKYLFIFQIHQYIESKISLERITHITHKDFTVMAEKYLDLFKDLHTLKESKLKVQRLQRILHTLFSYTLGFPSVN